jgi:predicted DNA-binding transcriptional regulator YafY
MGYIDHLRLLEKIHHLIDRECTGPSTEFARKLGISRRKLFRILEELRDGGIEINYSHKKRSYLYSGQTRIDI